MNWIGPICSPSQQQQAKRRLDRHRPGYWRDYYERNKEVLRAYLKQKAREYRAR